ncbi:MAG: SDR family oxidoreductase [Pseudomonadales bacterium]|jgi:NADP-dependent 3-hydroxy acid dehydrogenase YdfG|nr:SDR family oxidoreductase [Pseudomonadales bacterium]
MQLKGKTIAVTGASSGIGQCIAETLGAAGAHVFICGRTLDTLEASKLKIEAAGGGASIFSFDICDDAALIQFVEAAANYDDGLDAMINNAGLGYTDDPVADGNPAEWREMFDVNVLALLVGCQAAIRVMRAKGRPGRIINISSVAGLNRASGVYGATKHAVNTINATLRDELQDDDIRVTSIMPGVFTSNFIRNVDAEIIRGMIAHLGLKIDFQAGTKLTAEELLTIHEGLSKQIGDPKALADAVLYVLQQPANIGIDEMVIRPQKNLEF